MGMRPSPSFPSQREVGGLELRAAHLVRVAKMAAHPGDVDDLATLRALHPGPSERFRAGV